MAELPKPSALDEPLETINKRITDYYGLFESQSKFRLVWSNDQYERRKIDETPEGLKLLNPIIATVPKYMYARNRYILEKITPVPEQYIDSVGGLKLSYEPIWVFEDHKGEPVTPSWRLISLLFKSVEESFDRSQREGPIKQDEKDGNTLEAIQEREKALAELLYGNETDITDALAVGSAVGYGNYSRNDTRFNNNPIRKSE